MTEHGEFPSLMDEPDFLVELEKVECPPSAPSTDRAINVVRSTAAVNLPEVGQIRAAVPLFLMMLIGICAGAASSVLILHDRVARLIAFWSH